MSRFDGILMTQHLSKFHPDLKVGTVMRNGIMYEVAVSRRVQDGRNKSRLLFKMRCSLLILPDSLANLLNNCVRNKKAMSAEEIRRNLSHFCSIDAVHLIL